jgi:hypothetical protein
MLVFVACLPFYRDMAKTAAPRTIKNPPHISLATLRSVSGKRLADVCASVEKTLGVDKVHPGTISAIEKGIRGASQPMLDALALAYGLQPGAIVTDYSPRTRDLDVAS